MRLVGEMHTGKNEAGHARQRVEDEPNPARIADPPDALKEAEIENPDCDLGKENRWVV